MRQQKLAELYKKICIVVNSSLKYKLILYFLMLSFLPIAFLGGIFYNITRKITEDKVIKNAINVITTQQANLDLSDKNMETIISDATASSDLLLFVKSYNENDIETLPYDVLFKIDVKLQSIVDSRSDIITSVLLMPQKGQYPLVRGNLNFDYKEDFEKAGLYKTAIESNRINWFLIRSSLDGQQYICITKPINDFYPGKNIGILCICLYSGYIDDIFKGAAPEAGENTLVLDKSDFIILNKGSGRENDKKPKSDTRQAETKYSDATVLTAISKEKTGSMDIKVAGEPSIVTFGQTNIAGWKIINITPYKNISKDVSTVSKAALIFSVLCILYAIAIAIFVNRSIYHPIHSLSIAIKTLGTGDLNTHVSVTRTDELGKLAESFNDMAKRIKSLVENIELEQKKKTEIEIKMLQAQITPHFLYNTLNAIKSLARMGRSGDIMQMVSSLTRLLRVSANNNKDLITVEEELEYVDSYVKLMGYRYEKPLNLVIHLDDDLKTNAILKFTLQPIVENCVIHAFNDSCVDCSINIKVYREMEQMQDQKSPHTLIIDVIDNGIGMNDEKITELLYSNTGTSKMKFNNIGIANINERIKLYFGEQYGITFYSKIGEGTRVSIRIPLQEI